MPKPSAGEAAYRGRLGATRTEIVHVTCTCGAILAAEVYRSVNATNDPDVASRLADATAEEPFQTASCPRHDGRIPIYLPVLLHAPEAETFALVLPEAMRHRELEERAQLLRELAAEPEAEIPTYVRQPDVVFGRREVADLLSRRRGEAETARAPGGREAAAGEEVAAVGEREAAVGEREGAASEREAAVSEREAAVAERERTLDEREGRLRARERALQDRERKLDELEAAFESPKTPPAGQWGVADDEAPERRGGRELFRDAATEEIDTREGPADEGPGAEAPGSGAGESDDFGHVTIADLPADLLSRHGDDDALPGSLFDGHEWGGESPDDSLSSGELVVADDDAALAPSPSAAGETVVGGRHDVALERWMASGDDVLKRVDDQGAVHFAVSADDAALAELSADDLQLRVILHRLPTYPLVTIALGSAAAIDGESGDREPYPFLFDVGDADDAGVLAVLGRHFRVELSVYDREFEPVKKRTVSAGLAENVRYAVSTARDELSRIDPAEQSYTRAVIAFSDPSFDRYGRVHPQRWAFREGDLVALDSLAGVVRAVTTARHFSRPEHEDYLLLVRGYPLALWHEQRRHIIARAIECGIWMGPTLARMAVRDGAVASRKQLISVLQQNFAAVTSGGDGGLDEETARANWEALRREASALGLAGGDVLTSAPRTTPASAGPAQPLVSGTISNTPSGPGIRGGRALPDPRAQPGELGTADLVALLEDDEERRLAAALELARRRETAAVGAVFASVLRMTRKEAVEVLGAAVNFGRSAVPYLVEGMAARKAFLRQGCALALGILGTEDAVEALSDALVAEPTDVWSEIARALGEVGAPAVMSLVTRLRDRAEEAGPRVAWALAHIAARGHHQHVETLAQGRDPVAAGVAKQALELAQQAHRDETGVRGDVTPPDQTVNRAFSRKFFQAAAHMSTDISAPTMPLDEGDVLEARDAKDV